MPTGINTAYDLTVGVKVNMDEAIYMLSPADSPMITGVGADGLSVLSTSPVDEIAFSWMHDELLTPRSTLAAAVTTDEAVLTVASGHRTRFSTGDLLKVAKAGGSEVIRVTGYGTTTDTLLVTRGYDSSTKVNYVTDTTIIGLGTALAEGSDPEAARSRDRDEYSNYTQIFGPTSVHMSRSEQKVAKYGVANEFSRQVFARTQEMTIAREQAILYGRKTNSTTTKIRTMGGIDYYLTTNVDSTSTQLTVLKIQTQQQTTYNNGGLPDRLVANPASLIDLNDVANTSVVRTTLEDAKRGRHGVMEVWTEFGPITVVRNRWMLKTDAFLIRRENISRRIFDPLVLERLAKTGDADKVQLVCEESLEVKGESQMAKFNALAY